MSSRWTKTACFVRRAVLSTRSNSQMTGNGNAMASQTRSMSTAPQDSSSLQVQQRERLTDESILEHIVCPISKFPLRYDAENGSLICDEIRVAYPIRYGVPMLVPSEARIINDEEQQ